MYPDTLGRYLSEDKVQNKQYCSGCMNGIGVEPERVVLKKKVSIFFFVSMIQF